MRSLCSQARTGHTARGAPVDGLGILPSIPGKSRQADPGRSGRSIIRFER